MSDMNAGTAASQTYSRAGKVGAANSPAAFSTTSQATNNTGSSAFSDLIVSKIKEPLQAGYAAEQAVGQYHQGKISQQDFTQIMNDAQIQLAEFKTTVEKTLSTLQEVLRSSVS